MYESIPYECQYLYIQKKCVKDSAKRMKRQGKGAKWYENELIWIITSCLYEARSTHHGYYRLNEPEPVSSGFK